MTTPPRIIQRLLAITALSTTLSLGSACQSDYDMRTASTSREDCLDRFEEKHGYRGGYVTGRLCRSAGR